MAQPALLVQQVGIFAFVDEGDAFYSWKLNNVHIVVKINQGTTNLAIKW